MKNQMRGNPVNNLMLKRYISSSPVRRSYLIAALKTTYPTLARKLNGETEFTLWEAKVISDTLGLTVEERDAIFFGDK